MCELCQRRHPAQRDPVCNVRCLPSIQSCGQKSPKTPGKRVSLDSHRQNEKISITLSQSQTAGCSLDPIYRLAIPSPSCILLLWILRALPRRPAYGSPAYGGPMRGMTDCTAACLRQWPKASPTREVFDLIEHSIQSLAARAEFGKIDMRLPQAQIGFPAAYRIIRRPVNVNNNAS